MATEGILAVERQTALHYVYRFGDAAIIATCGILLGAWHSADGLRGAAPVHGFLTALCALGVLVVFPGFGLYESWRGRSRAALLLRLAAAWSLVIVMGLVTAFLMHQIAAVSRLWFVGWFPSSIVAMAGGRVVMFRMLGSVRRQGINARRVVIFGYGPLGQTDTIDKMRRRIEFDIHDIRHWSFQLDLSIILRTAQQGWTSQGAY